MAFGNHGAKAVASLTYAISFPTILSSLQCYALAPARLLIDLFAGSEVVMALAFPLIEAMPGLPIVRICF